MKVFVLVAHGLLSFASIVIYSRRYYENGMGIQEGTF